MSASVSPSARKVNESAPPGALAKYSTAIRLGLRPAELLETSPRLSHERQVNAPTIRKQSAPTNHQRRPRKGRRAAAAQPGAEIRGTGVPPLARYLLGPTPPGALRRGRAPRGVLRRSNGLRSALASVSANSRIVGNRSAGVFSSARR